MSGTLSAAAESYRDIESMETEDLLALYKETGDEDLKWPLVMRYEDLIRKAAMRVSGVFSNFAQLDDIVNEGIITLLNSIDKFDPDRGAKFETYVSKRIRGMVYDLARKQDWTPRNVRQRAAEIERATQELTASLGRYPTEAELIEKLNTTKERYQKDTAGIALSNVMSLDMLLDAQAEDDYRVEVPTSDVSVQPEKAFEVKDLRKTLAEGIATLNKNEQIVLSLYYEKNLNMKDIAQVMDLSGPRISQIHARAIEKLKSYMESTY